MIYYTHTDGTIIGGTSGSDVNGITHIPSGADYAIVIDDATVNSLNPNNEPGTYTMTNIVAGVPNQYGFPTATGTLTFTVMPQAQQLANAQSAQIALLRQGYAKTMASGFNVTIDTTQYTFGWSTDDKTNMLATQEAITDGDLTFPINYSDLNGHPVSIPDQTTLSSIKATATRFFNNNHQQILTLIGNVNSSTTVSAIQAITWTAATY